MKRFYTVALLLIIFAGAFFLFKPADMAEGAKTPQAMPALPVDTQTIMSEKAIIWRNFTGRVEAVEHAAIKPEVSGRITEVHFEDGQYVEKGDLLFVIDPAPLEATLQETEAALNIAKSEASLAEAEYQRAYNLRKSEAISESLYEERMRNRRNAAAAVKAAQALRDSAKINLEYAYVKAPISGRVSRAELTLGNRVDVGPNAQVLTEIITQDPVYLDFDIDEQSFIALKSAKVSEKDVPVKMEVGGLGVNFNGTIYSFDNKIDVGSATVRARALFQNIDGLLLPGMTARVSVGISDDEEKILIPSAAVGTDQNRKFVYVMNAENTVEYRPVSLGATIDALRVVTDGLKPGDILITSSIVKLRPGAAVSKKTDIIDGEMPSENNSDTLAEE